MTTLPKEHIVFVVNSLRVGGTEKIVVETSNELDFTKYDVTIVSFSLYDAANSIFNVVPPSSKIKVVYFPYHFDTDYSLFGYLKLFFKKATDSPLKEIVEYIQSLKPNIIHFHTSPRELIIAKLLHQKNKKVFTDHSLRIQPNQYGKIKTFILLFFLKRLYAKFNIITVSADIKNNLYQTGIVNTRKKIIVIPNSIDASVYEKDPSEDIEKLSVIYVSRIANGKGHKDLIKAWALLKNIPDKKLMIVGPDNLNGEIQRFAKENNCEDSTEFVGTVSNSKCWLAKANIAVFPSYKEGLPLSLLEKMSMQLPVIAYDIKELASIIEDKKTGILNKIGDFVCLAENILFLYNNKSLREQLGKNARAYILKHHHLGNVKKEIEKFYQEIKPS